MMSVEPIQTDGPIAGPPEPRREHPLGPLLRTRGMYSPLTGRLTALVLMLACGGLLIVAATLTPDPRGMGTHEQLALGGGRIGPCGFPDYVGIPCPSCGMTTAFAHTVRGELWQAARAQPMGFLLAIAAVATLCICAWSLITARVIEANWYRIDATRAVFLFMLGFVVAWGYKIAAFLLA